MELPDTDGGTQLAKLEKEVNGENVISLQIMLGSGSTFQLTPQLGILDLSSSADSETLESPDPVGRILSNQIVYSNQSLKSVHDTHCHY